MRASAVGWGSLCGDDDTATARLLRRHGGAYRQKKAQVSPYHGFKCSTLTLLYHGLESESLDEAIEVGKRNSEWELDELARGVAVQLVHTEKGWKMRTVHLGNPNLVPSCYENYWW